MNVKPTPIQRYAILIIFLQFVTVFATLFTHNLGVPFLGYGQVVHKEITPVLLGNNPAVPAKAHRPNRFRPRFLNDRRHPPQFLRFAPYALKTHPAYHTSHFVKRYPKAPHSGKVMPHAKNISPATCQRTDRFLCCAHAPISAVVFALVVETGRPLK